MKKWISLIVMALMVCTLAMSACAQTLTDVILTAGTTQAFKKDAVPEEDLTVILQAGLSAASAINQQPWHFAVITNPEIAKELSPSMGMPPMGAPAGGPAGAPAGMPPAPEGGAPMDMPKMPAASGAKASMGDSPVAIIVYMNKETKSPDANFDCGLATQNMVIAANALGYGTKIVSAPTMALNGENHDAICEQLGVDKAYSAVAVLLVGYTDTEADGATGASVRSALEEKVSFTK